MLKDSDAGTNIAVKDLATARQFYEGTLGFEPAGPPEEHLVTYRSGVTLIFVYQSGFAGSNRATTLTWMVEDVDRTVRELKKRGVTFEHYEMPGITRQGDVHVGGGRRVAWFLDPDGNILSIAGREPANG